MDRVSAGPAVGLGRRGSRGWPTTTTDLALAQDAQMMGDIAAGHIVPRMLNTDADGMDMTGAMKPASNRQDARTCPVPARAFAHHHPFFATHR